MRNEPSASKSEYQQQSSEAQLEPSRREFIAGLAGAAVFSALGSKDAIAQNSSHALNVARVALPSSRTMLSENKVSALNDGFDPVSSFDRSHGIFTLRLEGPNVFAAGTGPDNPERPWVQYDWPSPIRINKVEIYWAVERPVPGALPGTASLRRIQVPASYRLLYWTGSDFVPVAQAEGLATAPDTFNVTTFAPVETNKLRLEVDLRNGSPAGIVEWRVFNHDAVPELPPVIDAGVDRSVVSDGKTYLSGKVTWLEDSRLNSAKWLKTAGPGAVTFATPRSPVTTATFSNPGDYVLSLEASGSKGAPTTVNVHVEPAPPSERLDVVYTRKYSIDSPLWNQRAKALIVDWVPHCIAMCERTDIAPMRGDGGLDNFIEAGKALRGEPHARHRGYVFSNAWVHQTVESMCIALMVDPQGDPEIIKAHEVMRATLER